MKLILTCEHASSAIPNEFSSIFKNHKKRLQTHEGYDIGAFEIFKTLEHIADFSYHYSWSRLLIEVNRSLHHPSLFSSISKSLADEEKQNLQNHYYQPYRQSIQNRIEEIINTGEIVLHLSIHSFTPILNGNIRNTEFGILYDPKRKLEKEWAKNFKSELKSNFNNFRVRMNYPYLGKADGFTTSLRKKFPNNYIGIELEINQKLFKKPFNFQDYTLKLQNCVSNLK
ncbi:N-formylglutamate amidohydrolase [Psychroflexus aestuariivivens]|uniref:N-formylglutamate amidohydrolase n=1 Tax=Psychroflexus aestuariivivens TaxID=1795040 RepID=UPI000FD7DF04|nr:N-formylglutamate amidohydrolase [Psychroflexus aestuariivivens]